MAIWFPHKPSSRMQKLVIYWSLFTAAGCMCVWEGFKRHIVTCIIFSCSLALGQLDSTQFNVMLRKLASCTVAEVFGTVPELHRCNGAASDWERCLMLQRIMLSSDSGVLWSDAALVSGSTLMLCGCWSWSCKSETLNGFAEYYMFRCLFWNAAEVAVQNIFLQRFSGHVLVLKVS